MLEGARGRGAQLGGSLGTPEDVFKHEHELSALLSITYGISVCCASVSHLLRCSRGPSLRSSLTLLIGFYLVIFCCDKTVNKSSFQEDLSLFTVQGHHRQSLQRAGQHPQSEMAACRCSPTLLLFIQFWSPAYGIVLLARRGIRP